MNERYWLRLSQEARSRAALMKDETAKKDLDRIAEAYERLANISRVMAENAAKGFALK